MDDDLTLGELARSLVRIEMKLDQAIGDHETRLRRVERVMWVALGLAAAGGVSGIGTLLSAAGG
ncbi:MAG: hypothetical protein IRZ05_17555 [Micromonosporaceae bacterium]|nr:hypothetical protein [Micromonosporaceae bacterium]